MNQVSWGVILQGDPNCVQENRLWIRLTGFISSWGWVILGVAAVASIIYAFVENSTRFLMVGIWTLIAAVVLFCCSLIWSDKVRCAYCHHFTKLQRISDDMYVDSSSRTTSETVYDDNSGFVMDSHGDVSYYSGVSSHKEYGTETTTRYAYNVRCSLCGAVTKVERTKVSRQ